MLTYAKYLSPISLLTQKSWPILYTFDHLKMFLPSYWPRNPDQFYILCGPFEDVFTFLLTQKSWPILYTLWTIWRCFLPSYWPRNPDHFYKLWTIWRRFYLPTDPEILTIFIYFVDHLKMFFTFLLTQKSWPFLYTFDHLKMFFYIPW